MKKQQIGLDLHLLIEKRDRDLRDSVASFLNYVVRKLELENKVAEGLDLQYLVGVFGIPKISLASVGVAIGLLSSLAILTAL